MIVDKKVKSVGLAQPYENPHLTASLEYAVSCNQGCIDRLTFDNPPSFRSGNGWKTDTVVISKLNPIRAILRCFRWLVNNDTFIFLGAGSPRFAMPLMFVLASISGRRVFLVSEGFRGKKATWSLKALLAVVSMFGDGQLLAIGNTAADDFRRAGLKWTIRRFGFSERPPVAKDQLSSKHLLPNSRINLLVVGQLIPRKRVDWLFRAIAVHHCRHEVVINVCGDGPDRSMLSSLAQELRINAIFHGFISGERLAEQFNQADIFIHPAVYEGWGVVLNHALAYGLPIIAYTSVRSAKGILVKEGLNGFVFHDDSTFSQALEKLVTNKELREKFSYASKALSNFWSVDFIGNRLSRLLIDEGQDWGDESPLSKISIP